MTAREIVNKIKLSENALDYQAFDNKHWYEMYLCERVTRSKCKCKYTYETKSLIQYKGLDEKNNKIILSNNRHKVIKELSQENTIWIGSVYLCDKHLRFCICNLDFVKIDKLGG